MTNSSSNSQDKEPKSAENAVEQLPLLYRDDDIVVVDKPSGLLVHRSPIDRRETRFALQILREQLGQYIYPVHRLDKPTSGVMVFGLHSESASVLAKQFAQHQIRKAYLATVRGYAPASGCIDHPLRADPDRYAGRAEFGDAKPAITHYQCLAQYELDACIEKYPQSRYSLVLAQPLTGRPHQIRRHMKHIAHPIIGDAKHGRGRHNRYFAEHLACPRLLLHAMALEFSHPASGQRQRFVSPLTGAYAALVKAFNWQTAVNTAEHRLGWPKVT